MSICDDNEFLLPLALAVRTKTDPPHLRTVVAVWRALSASSLDGWDRARLESGCSVLLTYIHAQFCLDIDSSSLLPRTNPKFPAEINEGLGTLSSSMLDLAIDLDLEIDLEPPVSFEAELTRLLAPTNAIREMAAQLRTEMLLKAGSASHSITTFGLLNDARAFARDMDGFPDHRVIAVLTLDE